MAKVKLGDRYKDSMTGFEGTATTRCEYLNGCISVQLQADSKDGAEPVSHWVDEQQLEGVESKARTGGPGATPPARTPPGR